MLTPLALPLDARIERAVARALFRLPPRAQIALCGGSARVIGGHTLHPQMQLLLALRKLRGARGLRDDNVPRARAKMRAESVRFPSDCPALGDVHDVSIPGTAGSIPARHYAPKPSGAAQPMLVYFHGGGFVLGDIETFDSPCRLLCHHANVHVLSVDYRLAPEHPFPAAVEDALAAFRWAHAHATELGADPRAVGVGGDSAGGNLSAVVCQQTRGEPSTPAFQLLIYPLTDMTHATESLRLFDHGLLLERDDIDWFDELYLERKNDLRTDVRVSPLLERDLRGLCPAAVITAELDTLRDEGEAYARAMQAAGARVTQRREPGLIHGFLNMAGVSPLAETAVLALARDLSTLAHGAAASHG